MNYGKKVLAYGLSFGLAASVLSGCYTKVKFENYDKTKVAAFGDKDIMLDEANYYVKLQQVNYDSNFYYYSYFYGFKSRKDMYEADASNESKKNLWDILKEDAMSALYQTYVLCDHAEEYNVSLTDEDKEKVVKSVKDYYENGDGGLKKSINISEEHLTDLLMRNALAIKVYDYIVKDIDTEVDDTDLRHTMVSYIKVTEAEKKEEETKADAKEETKADAETTAETTEAEKEKVDLKAAADKIKTDWEKEFKDSDDYTKAANKVVESYKDNSEVAATYTATTNYAKPTVAEGEEEAKDSLQKYCYENLKTGDFGIYEDGEKTVYVVYCYDDDDEESKQKDVETELNKRKAEMFNEKWPDIVKASPEWKVESRVYAQIKYAEIDYDEPTTAETTEAKTTEADETKADETEAEETKADETEADETEEVTTASETAE